MKTFYITKYALTQGVLEVQVPPLDIHPTYVTCKPSPKHHYRDHLKLGEDVFETRADAVKNACERRDTRAKSLRKQMEKIEKITF